MFFTFQAFFIAAYSFPQQKMSIKCLLITNLVLGKVEEDNHIRKVLKSEERKVKNIGKISFLNMTNISIIESNFILVPHRKIMI